MRPDSSAVPALFLDTELADAHFVDINSADHLLDRLLVAARVVDSLVHTVHKHLPNIIVGIMFSSLLSVKNNFAAL